MNSQLTSTHAALSGGHQEPLLSADQLNLITPAQIAAGVFLTGPAWERVWRLMQEPVDGVITIHNVMRPLPADNHIHSLNPRGECTCGLRKQAVADILTTRTTTPKTFLITPTVPLTLPNAFSVYVTAGGTLVLGRGDWSMTLPIIPKLGVLWTVPVPLRRFLGGAA